MQVTSNLKNTVVLTNLLRFVEALISNPTLFLEPYVSEHIGLPMAFHRFLSCLIFFVRCNRFVCHGKNAESSKNGICLFFLSLSLYSCACAGSFAHMYSKTLSLFRPLHPTRKFTWNSWIHAHIIYARVHSCTSLFLQWSPASWVTNWASELAMRVTGPCEIEPPVSQLSFAASTPINATKFR